MINIKTQNLADTWHTLCGRLRDHPHLVPKSGGGFNFRGDYYIHLYDVFVQIKSCRCPDLCLEDVGYSSRGSKATHLLSRYLDIEKTNRWLDYIVERMMTTPDVYGELPLRTKKHYTKRAMAGGCISELLFRGAPKPTLVVITRAMELPTKGLGDIFFVSALARVICDRLGIPDMRIRWYLASVWTRSRTANYYIIYKYPEKVVWANKNFQAHVDRAWKRYYLSDYEFSYNANVRAKELFLKKKAGKLKRVSNSDLFYEKLVEYLG